MAIGQSKDRMKGLVVRLATADDLEVINDIYNHYVVNSTATFAIETMSFQERADWYAAHSPRHPIIVAEHRKKLLGWGSLTPFHGREAYALTVEDSVYLRQDYTGLGIGVYLLSDLIERAKLIGHHTIVGIISTDQTASLALHHRLGFREHGRLRQVGYKFGRWLDVAYMQLMLNEDEPEEEGEPGETPYGDMSY